MSVHAASDRPKYTVLSRPRRLCIGIVVVIVDRLQLLVDQGTLLAQLPDAGIDRRDTSGQLPDDAAVLVGRGQLQAPCAVDSIQSGIQLGAECGIVLGLLAVTLDSKRRSIESIGRKSLETLGRRTVYAAPVGQLVVAGEPFELAQLRLCLDQMCTVDDLLCIRKRLGYPDSAGARGQQLRI